MGFRSQELLGCSIPRAARVLLKSQRLLNPLVTWAMVSVANLDYSTCRADGLPPQKDSRQTWNPFVAKNIRRPIL